MKILIDNQEYFFDESEAVADANSIARQFTLVDINKNQRFSKGQTVKIFDDLDILFIVADIEYIEVKGNSEESTFIYAGRNDAKFIVDAYANKTTQFSQGQDINSVLSEVATPFGISVTGSAKLPKQDIRTILIGEKISTAFIEIAQTAGKIITSDAKGNLSIEFQAVNESEDILEYGTNILHRDYINNSTELYEKYTIVSQSNYLFNQQQDVNVQGSYGSGKKEKVKVSKSTLTINECEKLAQIEYKKDIRRSISYEVKTNNVHYDLNKTFFIKDVPLEINEKMNCKTIILAQDKDEFYTKAIFEKVV